MITEGTTGYGQLTGDTIVNDGSIIADGAYIQNLAANTVNNGTVYIGGPSGLYWNNYGTLTNNGVFDFASVNVGTLYNLINDGKINLINGGGSTVLDVQGSLTLANLGTIQSVAGATLDIAGTLDLGGGTLDITPGSTLSSLQITGELTDGTVDPDSRNLACRLRRDLGRDHRARHARPDQ